MVTVMGRRSRSRDRGQQDYGGHRQQQFYGGYRNARGDYAAYFRDRFGSASPEEYQNLRLSHIAPSVQDQELRRILEKEFSRFGDMHAKIISNTDFAGGRIAYVNFDRCGDARIARSTVQQRMQELLGSKVQIDPAGIIKDHVVGRYVPTGRNSPPRRQIRNRSLDMDTGLSPPPSPRDRTRVGNRYYGEALPPRRRVADRSRSPLDSPPARRRQGSPSAYALSMNHGRRGRSRTPPPGNFGRYGGNFQNESSVGDRRSNFRSVDSDERHYSSQQNAKRDRDPEMNATRTLFVGNLSHDVQSRDLRDTFDQYGVIEDIDVKRNNEGPAFAFVQFQNLDMARKAKIAETGTTILHQRVTIGYGKPKQSCRLWVGGLGRGVSLELLEREFDRFGAIKKIDFVRGENHAYILFDSLDAAIEACASMKGFEIGERKLRVDFASDDIAIDGDGNSGSNGAAAGRTRRQSDGSSVDSAPPRAAARSNHRRSSPESGTDHDHSSSSKKDRTTTTTTTVVPRSDPLSQLTRKVSSVDNDLLSKTPLLPQVWTGAFVLKRSAYPIMLFHLKGSMSLLKRYVCDKEGASCPLVVSQRLKLDQPKKEDIPKWIASPDYCFLIAIPWQSASQEDIKSLALPTDESGASMQSRSLKLLVKYFKEKDAAGVVNLTSSKALAAEPLGMLYAFPECAFAASLLESLSNKVEILRTCSEEVLLLVLIRGTV